ncbi:hypothetical protein P4284_07165 [Bacillus swezeyi]|uniref:hypothetical protein n=1 Tax=Bacillus swezeyi TaxID=1925020 RepID=UPI002E224188|nr:hypothetical protein [Bacillus swezeyi]MED2976492.1 hypothetical protein [Bacillus swezeyi]
MPISQHSVVSWSTPNELINSIRYEFFFSPLFIFFLGSLFDLRDWMIIRRFLRREQITLYKVGIVIGFSLILSFFLGVESYISYIIIEKLSALNITYQSLLIYLPNKVDYPPFIFFMAIFFLTTCLIGTIYVLFIEIFSVQILAAFIVLLLVIADRMSISVIPLLFNIGYEKFPIQMILGLILVIGLFTGISFWVSKYKDFYGDIHS